jgi:hypothetical protein
MNDARVIALPHVDFSSNNHIGDYLETIGAFIAQDDEPANYIFPELLPCNVLSLWHGDPRARKSLSAFELALAAATGTAPFGLARFKPAGPVPVIYVMEEDPRSLTRPRLRALVRARCGDEAPADLHVAVRRGINLDDPVWVERLISDATHRHAKLMILDAARRLSAQTDEGPAKVRELTGVLRSIYTRADLSIVIVHHDVKPPQNGAQDTRRRSQRASGGDWFAASECPVHVERINDRETLIYPQDYKFTGDPAPFTFRCEVAGGLITQLVGTDTSTEHAEAAGASGKLLAWLRANPHSSKTAMKKAGFGWEAVETHLAALMKAGKVDAGPGRKAGSNVYWVVEEPSS